MDWRNWNNVVDVSSFMLFESTGDSEADSDLNMVANSLSDDNMGVTNEVDDALSCCSESSVHRDYNIDDHDQDQYEQFSKKKEQHYDHYNPRYRDDDEEEEEDDKDDAIDQDWTSGKEGFVFARKNKSNVYEDSTMEPMKKEEQDKLFWETCLAS